MDPDYSWQDAAVERWEGAHFVGIVEAVTGTGKTYMGLKALQRMRQYAHDNGFRLVPIVVVPSDVLQDQWVNRIQSKLPGFRAGRFGNGRQDGFHQGYDVIVGVVNSVARHGRELLHFVDRADYRPLLIADECHRYLDGRCFRQVLDLPFVYRLGLTPRMPPGSHINFQVEGLGSIVYELDMRRSRAFGLIPPFHLLNIPVDLSAQELDQYDRLSSDIATQMRTLAPLLSRSTDEFEDQTIFARLKRLYLDQEQESPLRKDIETLYRMLFTRASVYHLAESKREAVVRAIRLLLEFGKKTIVFYERIVSADETEAELSADEALRIHRAVTNGHSGFWCRVCHSLQTNSERQAVLAEFAEPGPKVLIACRSLDEGFDVPEVDAAILAASTQSTRQRIQRIGRVLRKFSEDKRAIILTLYVPGTGDARVVAGDREMFAGPTDMFECKAGTWERVLRQLLECYGRPADIASAQHEPRHRTSVPTPEGRT